jgi:ATP-dependent RNA helicase DHX29
VAERVAAERGEPGPGRLGGRVGYHVRLDAARTRATRLLFCTTGILLRRLAGDPNLVGVSHIVVDEVHERTLQGDFLMALLRDLVVNRRRESEKRTTTAAGARSVRPLKVVLMSATLDASLFASYFSGAAVLEAGGRTFPVEHRFLEDVYEETGYVLAADSQCAVRPDRGGARGGAERKRLERGAGGGTRGAALIRSGWGDDDGDAAPLNKHYDPAAFEGYSPTTLRNLGRLDEAGPADLDLIEDVVSHIDAAHPPGAVLVFLPGLAEITALADRLAALPAHREGRLRILPLHSTVSAAEQRRVFDRPPPGMRKVVLATNIAETSITIDDVVYCIDSGKHRERRHDPARGMGLLVEDFVSRASALQRKGRAGRVTAGTCFALYTRDRFERRMRAFQSPEMVRVPLEELVLQIHALGLGPAAGFLARVLEPPPPRAVDGAVSALTSVGALTPGEALTPLGRHLAALPLDPRLGKLLLYASALGCLAPALTIAAALAHRPPFATPLDDQGAVGRVKAAMATPGSASGGIAAGQQSDHLLAAAAYAGWAAERARGGRGAGAAYARAQCLSTQALEMLRDMRGQFAAMLADSGFVAKVRGGGGGGGAGAGAAAWYDSPAHPANTHARRPVVVKAALTAALYPNVALMDEGSLASATAANAKPGWHAGAGPVALHPGSVNAPLAGRAYGSPYVIFLEKVRTSRAFLRDTTVVGAIPLLLFGGSLDVRHSDGTVIIDGWLTVRAAAPTAVLVKKLRGALDAALAQRVAGSGCGGSGSGGGDADSDGAAVVAAIVDLLQDEGAAMAAAVAASVGGGGGGGV